MRARMLIRAAGVCPSARLWALGAGSRVQTAARSLKACLPSIQPIPRSGNLCRLAGSLSFAASHMTWSPCISWVASNHLLCGFFSCFLPSGPCCFVSRVTYSMQRTVVTVNWVSHRPIVGWEARNWIFMEAGCRAGNRGMG